MKKKQEKVEKAEVEIITDVVYKVFDIADDGHFIEPVEGNRGYIFDHYAGYPSVDEARKAISEYAKRYGEEEGYFYHHEYQIVTTIRVSEQQIKKEDLSKNNFSTM